MELDRALELAVVSSWADLVKPAESCSVHVEYKNVSDLPLDSLEVWAISNRGYGTLVCRYSSAPSNSALRSSAVPKIRFANSYQSKTLVNILDFIMRHQGQFARPVDHSVHGLVQIDRPSDQDRSDAAGWSQAVLTESAETVWN